MDRRHRVYYLVNLNQNHKKSGWWVSGWDSFGSLYELNMHMLKQHIPGLKISPSHLDYFSTEYYQLKLSCRKEKEYLLVDMLNKLPQTEYKKI